MGSVNNAVSIACGDDLQQFLHDYAKQNKEFLEPNYGPEYECPDCNNLLNNLKVVYDRLANGNPNHYSSMLAGCAWLRQHQEERMGAE